MGARRNAPESAEQSGTIKRGAKGWNSKTDPAVHRVRAASLVLPESVPFHEAAPDALIAKEGVAHVSV